MRKTVLVTLLAMLSIGLASAQTIDLFEFGKNSAIAVKLATQLDYLNQKCKKESAPIYMNQTDFILTQIGGRSAKSIRENAAKVMGVTPERVRQLAIDEANEVLSQLGGCQSKKLLTATQSAALRWGEYQKYLVDVADMVHRNPGRNIFR